MNSGKSMMRSWKEIVDCQPPVVTYTGSRFAAGSRHMAMLGITSPLENNVGQRQMVLAAIDEPAFDCPKGAADDEGA